MKLRSWINSGSYIWTIAASLYIIFDRHSYVDESGISVWAGIAIIIIGLFGYKKLGSWCIEWGMIDNGKGMLIKTFRRPFFAGMYIYGSLMLTLLFASYFMAYVERNLVSLSGTLELMVFVALIGYAISFASMFIPITKGD